MLSQSETLAITCFQQLHAYMFEEWLQAHVKLTLQNKRIRKESKRWLCCGVTSFFTLFTVRVDEQGGVEPDIRTATMEEGGGEGVD